MAHASGLQPIARRCPRQRHLPPAPDSHAHRNRAGQTPSGGSCRQGSPAQDHGEPSGGFRPGSQGPCRTPAEASLTGRAREDDPRHERKTGAQWPRSEGESIPCGHRGSQAGSASRGAGEKDVVKTDQLAPPKNDAPALSIPRSLRCPDPGNPPNTRCPEAQLAQCEQTLWPTGSKRGSGSGRNKNP